MEQAVDALLTLGGSLISPAAIGKLGPWHPALRKVEFTVFDTETTGLNRQLDRIIELAAIRLSVAGEISRFETLINPGFPIPEIATSINGITDEDVAGAPPEEEALRDFAVFCKGSILVAHNLEFDTAFVSNVGDRHGIEFDVSGGLDTLGLSRGKPNKPGLISRDQVDNFKLTTLTKHLGIPHENAHRAMADVEGTARLLDWLLVRKYRLMGSGQATPAA
jgi:DNA polymerase III alpha subunit (gram-positive type)